METIEVLGQEWCSAENIDLKQTSYITKFEPVDQKWMVLCNKEKYSRFKTGEYSNQTFESEGGIRYRPLKFEDLNLAQDE